MPTGPDYVSCRYRPGGPSDRSAVVVRDRRHSDRHGTTPRSCRRSGPQRPPAARGARLSAGPGLSDPDVMLWPCPEQYDETVWVSSWTSSSPWSAADSCSSSACPTARCSTASGRAARGRCCSQACTWASAARPTCRRRMAALLYAGPRSLITGPVAMLHHGVRGQHDLNT